MSAGTRDENRVPSLIAKSDAANTPVVVEADPATKRLKTNSTITGSVITAGLINADFDTIQITSYNANDDPLIVVYRTGGASGTIQFTLNITYDGSNRITEVVRS